MINNELGDMVNLAPQAILKPETPFRAALPLPNPWT